MNNFIKKIPNRYRFLTVVLLIYVTTSIFDMDFVFSSLKKSALNLFEILPIILFVYILMYLINRYVNTKIIQKHMGQESGIKGWLYAILGSIIISGPAYLLFPLIGELKKSGMKNSLIAIFLNNKNVQLSFLPPMVYYFGLRFTVVISIYIIIFTVLSGIIIDKVLKNEKLPQDV